jgi:hypothetical protein
MKIDQFSRLLGFLERLDSAKIGYVLKHSRVDALMIVAYSPVGYWEIEFLVDGEIEIERYRSDGRIEDESILEELFASWADPDAETPSPRAATTHEPVSSK